MIQRFRKSASFHALSFLTGLYFKQRDRVGRNVYITFDDGPDPEPTQFVLDQMSKFGYKATFFCVGGKVEANPESLEKLKSQGHSIGSHTFSHINGFSVPASDYLNDVDKAGIVTGSVLFRPPWGTIPFFVWLRLKLKGYRIISWTRSSGDISRDTSLSDECLERLCMETKKGDVILFHFSDEHYPVMKKILPGYLQYLSEHGFISKEIL